MEQTLEESSENLSSTKRRVDVALVSNDQGYLDIKSELFESLKSKHGGIGIFIGSGGVFSMLPDLLISKTLIVDNNPAVHEYSRMIESSIIESKTPGEVWDQLNNPKLGDKFKISKDLRKEEYMTEINLGLVNREAEQYGKDHWTDPSRFNFVKAALIENPPVYLIADVTNSAFEAKLQEVSNKLEAKIVVANFSNVHQWIDPKTRGFMEKWPFNDDPVILFSNHKGQMTGDYPKMQIVRSVHDYISEAKQDTLSYF